MSLTVSLQDPSGSYLFSTRQYRCTHAHTDTHTCTHTNTQTYTVVTHTRTQSQTYPHAHKHIVYLCTSRCKDVSNAHSMASTAANVTVSKKLKFRGSTDAFGQSVHRCFKKEIPWGTELAPLFHKIKRNERRILDVILTSTLCKQLCKNIPREAYLPVRMLNIPVHIPLAYTCRRACVGLCVFVCVCVCVHF